MNLVFQVLFLILIMALSWRGGLSTCVLESDFGFSLNCQFKKSSIFRVRNLGGVKGYVGLGFSVGDELGFGQSLSNLEGNKRRSTNGRSSGLSSFLDAENSVGKKPENARAYQGVNTRPDPYKSVKVATVPPFKPIPPAEKVALKPLGYNLPNTTRPEKYPVYSINAIPSFQNLPVSASKIQASIKAPHAFKSALAQATNNFGMQSAFSNYLNANKLAHRTPQIHSSGPQLINVVQAHPQIDRISANSAPVPVKLLPTAIPVSNSVTTEKAKITQDLGSVMMGDTVKSLSQATNISAEAIAAAISLKQQQLLKEQKTQKIIKTTSTTTTTTTTTERAAVENTRKYPLAAPSRVMNAPREYYPVGYDKNFDDNFVSRVELPETSFYCGEQKHFPGLYADEDLGCMGENRASLCVDNSCESRPRNDVRSSGYAIKAAQDAQEAHEAQQCAGAMAARQVKCHLAEKAQQAAQIAEAALSGKLAMVEQLQYQVREAAAVVLEAAASCHQTQMQLQLALAAAAQAGQLLSQLTTGLQMAQNNFVMAHNTAEGAKQELILKAALVDAARARANALLRELAVAMQDLNTIRQATYSAQVSATNATNNANRNKRRMQSQDAPKRRRKRQMEVRRRRRRSLGYSDGDASQSG